MKDVIFDDYQNIVNESLLRHKSILDIMTKLQESQSRVNRAIAKSATTCGCIKIKAEKQTIPNDEDARIEDLKTSFNSQIEGELCDNCREIIERELGSNMFYIASLCNSLDLNLYDILLKEYTKIKTLGKFTFR